MLRKIPYYKLLLIALLIVGCVFAQDELNIKDKTWSAKYEGCWTAY